MADSAYDYDDIKNPQTLLLTAEGGLIGSFRKAETLASLKEVKWTYKDYKDWKFNPNKRVELIYGIVYAMSAPNTRHQWISVILTGEFYKFLEGKTCRPIPAPYDVRLFYKEDESDDTVVQPDLIIVCDPKKLGKEGCRGTPDLVIEILSPSNTIAEMNRKKNLYLKAGVQEFWIVDPEEKLVEINILKEEKYTSYFLHMGEKLKPLKFPEFELPLEILFKE